MPANDPEDYLHPHCSSSGPPMTTLASIPPSGLHLLREYTNWTDPEIITAVDEARHVAEAAYPGPCSSRLRFLQVHSSAESVVTQLLQTGGEKGGDTTERPLNVLDAGCGVGQNLRYLSTALGGFERDLGLYGIDLSDAWFDIGYQLFRDRSTLHATLVCANLLDATSQQEGEGISQLHGRMDMIIADNLFHLFSRDDQIRVATQLIRCSRACPGASIRGVHAGASEAHHYRPAHQHQTLLESADCGKDLVLIHDPSSFKLLWKEVSDLSATKWVVTECTFDPAACTLSWSVERG